MNTFISSINRNFSNKWFKFQFNSNVCCDCMCSNIFFFFFRKGERISYCNDLTHRHHHLSSYVCMCVCVFVNTWTQRCMSVKIKGVEWIKHKSIWMSQSLTQEMTIYWTLFLQCFTNDGRKGRRFKIFLHFFKRCHDNSVFLFEKLSAHDKWNLISWDIV